VEAYDAPRHEPVATAPQIEIAPTVETSALRAHDPRMPLPDRENVLSRLRQRAATLTAEEKASLVRPAR
jgi:hypothetical protein